MIIWTNCYEVLGTEEETSQTDNSLGELQSTTNLPKQNRIKSRPDGYITKKYFAK